MFQDSIDLIDTTEIIDLNTNEWTDGQKMPVKIWRNTWVIYDNVLYIIGKIRISRPSFNLLNLH